MPYLHSTPSPHPWEGSSPSFRDISDLPRSRQRRWNRPSTRSTPTARNPREDDMAMGSSWFRARHQCMVCRIRCSSPGPRVDVRRDPDNWLRTIRPIHQRSSEGACKPPYTPLPWDNLPHDAGSLTGLRLGLQMNHWNCRLYPHLEAPLTVFCDFSCCNSLAFHDIPTFKGMAQIAPIIGWFLNSLQIRQMLWIFNLNIINTNRNKTISTNNPNFNNMVVS